MEERRIRWKLVERARLKRARGNGGNNEQEGMD